MIGPQINLGRIQKYCDKGWRFYFPGMSEVYGINLERLTRRSSVHLNSSGMQTPYRTHFRRIIRSNLYATMPGNESTHEKSYIMHSELMNALYTSINSKLTSFEFSNIPYQVSRFLENLQMY